VVALESINSRVFSFGTVTPILREDRLQKAAHLYWHILISVYPYLHTGKYLQPPHNYFSFAVVVVSQELAGTTTFYKAIPGLKK
jgi:hypothetical protein